MSHFENLLNIQPNVENGLKQRVDQMKSNACNIFYELNFKITMNEAISMLKRANLLELVASLMT